MIALEAGSWVAERQEWERQFSLRVVSHFLNVESHDYVAYTQVNHNEQEAAVLAGGAVATVACCSHRIAVLTDSDLGWSFPTALFRSGFLKLLVGKWAMRSI